MSKNRLEAFSDGVIAVAITLLALDLAVPGPGHGNLLNLLGERWPEFAAYAVSFFLIGIIWVNHHARFNLIAVVDRTLLFLNLVLLLFVVLIPFATATVAAYLTSPSENANIAMAAAPRTCAHLDRRGRLRRRFRRRLRQRADRARHHRSDRRVLHLRPRPSRAGRIRGVSPAIREAAAVSRRPHGLSNVTDTAEVMLSIRPHAAECHQTENLGAGR
jgi:hypothetical protein